MQMFRKSFGQAVTQCFEQDRIIIIPVRFELLRLRFFSEPSGDSKAANIVVFRGAKVRDRKIRLALRPFRNLLPKPVEMREGFAAGFIGKDLHIIALLRSGPETENRIGAHPFLSNDLV